MVRALPNNPWRCADFLERVRPGLAVSAALHIGLLFALAYFLAFRPQLQVPAPAPDEPMQYVEIPKPPPKPVVPHDTIFHPEPTPTIEGVHSTVPPVPLPPEMNFHREPPQTVTSTEIAPTIIVNPNPIYRGGLIYPDRAAEMGREGYVDFDFVIEPDGTVGDPRVVAEVPDGIGFAAAAKKAFPKWRFSPMMKDGHPVAAPARIRVSFKLN
jgi:protein TonB